MINNAADFPPPTTVFLPPFIVLCIIQMSPGQHRNKLVSSNPCRYIPAFYVLFIGSSPILATFCVMFYKIAHMINNAADTPHQVVFTSRFILVH